MKVAAITETAMSHGLWLGCHRASGGWDDAAALKVSGRP